MGREGERGSIWSALVVVLALIAAVCVILVLVAGSRQSSARRGWQGTLGAPEEVFARWPAREANGAALELERLAAVAGVDVVPRSRGAPRRPRPRVGDPRRDRMHELREWTGERLGDGTLSPQPLPPELAAWLESIDDELAAVRDALVDGETPEWERRLEALFQAPVPNLLGLLELQSLLVADALLRAGRGDDATASRDLEAAWRLATTLLDEPEQITNLVGISIARGVAGALRHVESAPLEWAARLRALDPRPAVIDSLLISAWMLTQDGEGGMVGGPSPNDNALTRTLQSIAAPYVRMSMADLSERLRVRIEKLQRVDPRCDADLESLGVGFDLRLPRWSIAHSAYGPGAYDGVVERANRLELDLELSARLVELRAARRANGGRWPARLPGDPSSSACPDDRWLFEVDRDGSARLALSRVPEWRELPPRRRGVLPVSIELR